MTQETVAAPMHAQRTIRTPTRRIARNESRARASWQRGVALQRQGRVGAARELFERAVRLAPRDVLYWINLARCEQRLGLREQALEHAERAFALDRASLIACILLASIQIESLHTSDALHTLDALDPAVERDASWHLRRGTALLGAMRPQPAADAMLAAIQCPGCDEELRRDALSGLGHAFRLLRHHHEAATCYRMVVDADSASFGHALLAAHCGTYSCDWAQLGEDLKRADECIAAARIQPSKAKMDSFTPFAALNLSDDPALLRWLSELVWADRSASADGGELQPASTTPRLTEAVPRPGGKLRLGLLSSDFHHHATMMLAIEVLEAIDKERFELFLYSNSPNDRSSLQQRVFDAAAQVHEVTEWGIERLVEQIRSDSIAVLFDLKGFTLNSRMGAMASRPAPIQVAWLGFPGTTGAPFIDYVIGDPVVTPLDAQAHYSECIAQMPHCYQPNDSSRSRPTPMSRAECGLPEHGFVFASFNQTYKILPPVFEAWCRILLEVPDSVLWLMVDNAASQERIRRAAAAHGVQPQRLVFAPSVQIERHRARLPNADLCLDTFPYGGHTTASDALWAGVPVLTMIGQSFASRVAASLVATLGLPELVCDDLGGYTAKALHYACDPGALAELRRRVELGTADSPLFDGQRFARDLEELLLRMVERHDAGLAPEPLAAARPCTRPGTAD